jgi:hypothetical protein
VACNFGWLFSGIRFGKAGEEQTSYFSGNLRGNCNIIYMQVIKTIANYDLETKAVGLSADNTNTNFEALLRTCKKLC